MDKTSVYEANQRFAMERKEVVAEYNATVAELKHELSMKVRKLDREKEKKLLDISKRQDKFNDEYRQWKQEWLKQQQENEQSNIK